MSRKPRQRRFFAARSDVSDAFIRMAERKNLTLYGLLTDVLKKVVDLDTIGVSLEEAVRKFRLFRTSQEVGFVAVPERLWHEIAELSLRADPQGTTVLFAEAGEWIGNYALAKSQGTNSAQDLIMYLAPLTSDASEFSIDGSDTLRLRCVNPRYSQAYTELFSALLSKAVETVGYGSESRVLSKGVIFLSFRKLPKLEHRVRGEITA